MIISLNNEADRTTFEGLLSCTLATLQLRAIEQPLRFQKLLGKALEQEVYEVINENARDTPFEDSIELISGQSFPDIIAKRYYGVEVKTTKSNRWKSVGSSVAEGTRVPGIERIFMLFGKMSDPVEFLCRPYEECLSDVVVTHSPRYLIDMQLQEGETFFDKIKIPYDTLRCQKDPIKPIVQYYRKHLKEGEELWWINNQEDDSIISNPMIVRIWNNLLPTERHTLVIEGFCLFPELLGKQSSKFNRFAIWLATRQSVVCPNVRDLFTAGGKETLSINGIVYSSQPKIVALLAKSIADIRQKIEEIAIEELARAWGCEIIGRDRYTLWTEQVLKYNSLPAVKQILYL